MIVTLEVKFHIGQEVYLKTDPDQYKRIVTGIFVNPNGIRYLVSHGEGEAYYYALEISNKKDIVKSISN